MNVIGLPMTISLVLARQAGVSDPALDKAIDKSARFLRYYVDKGAKALEKDAAHQQGAKNMTCTSVTGNAIIAARNCRTVRALRPKDV
jgi:hypothetical protein